MNKMWRDIQFKFNSEIQIFEKLINGTLRVLARNLLSCSPQSNIFFHISVCWRCPTWCLNRGLTSDCDDQTKLAKPKIFREIIWNLFPIQKHFLPKQKCTKKYSYTRNWAAWECQRSNFFLLYESHKCDQWSKWS